MKRILCLLMALLFLWSCGGEEPAGTKATESGPKERAGITFSQEHIWRATETILETPATFEIWLKLPSVKQAAEQILISTDGNGTRHVTLTVNKKGSPTLTWKVDEELQFVWNFKDVALESETWQHLTVVRDAAAGRIYCYVNGELADEIRVRGSADIVVERPYCVGGDHSPKNERPFEGEISSVAIFSVPRTAEQIKADMQKPEGEGLLCYYELAGAEETVEDLSGNGLTMIKSTRWFTDKEPVTDFAYSMVVVGDTQLVALKNPSRMPLIADYIVANKEAKNIQFVIGVGDITEDDTVTEWEAARETYYRLDGVVPYGLVRGNEGHDGIYNFEETFPLAKYQDQISGVLGDDMRNVYYNFDVGDVKYTVIILDSSPDDVEVAWAAKVMEDHPDRNVILATHIFLFRDGTTYDGTDPYPFSPHDGQQLWDALLRKHENLVLVVCGHDSCSQVVEQKFVGDHGNVVTGLLVDGQEVDSTDGASGLIAILHFSEDGKNVTVEYYSPIKNQYFLTENQFSFTLDTVD